MRTKWTSCPVCLPAEVTAQSSLGKRQAVDLVGGGTKFRVEHRAAAQRGPVPLQILAVRSGEGFVATTLSDVGRESPVFQLVQVERCQGEMGLCLFLSQGSVQHFSSWQVSVSAWSVWDAKS